jgi:hypothetical protein
LACVPYATLIYCLWWNNPYEINIPTELTLTGKISNPLSSDGGFDHSNRSSHGDIARSRDNQRSSLCSVTGSADLRAYQPYDNPQTGTYSGDTSSPQLQIQAYRNYSMIRQFMDIPSDYFESAWHQFVTSLVFVVVGAIHLGAWGFSFATPAEHTAWRVGSMIIMSSIPLAWLNAELISRLLRRYLSATKRTQSFTAWYRYCIANGSVVLYALARLYLLVEVFLALRASPKGVYKTPEWTNFLSHFG